MNDKACKENNDCVHIEVDCVSCQKKSEKINPISLIVFLTNNKGNKVLYKLYKTINFTLKSKNYRLRNCVKAMKLENFVCILIKY